MSGPPVYPECVIGYRSWYAGSDAGLWPAGWVPAASSARSVHRPWQAGPNTAACPLADHAAPDQHCTCGLYAGFDVPAPAHGFVVGAVAAWGLVQVHRDGFRAEHAQITALRDDPARTDLRAIAARYRVPLVAPGLLELEAQRHGRDVTPRRIPGAAPAA
jgi:hypothetical protein